MPVIKKKIGRPEHPDHAALVAELIRHLQGGEGLPAFPRIVEEDVPLTKTVRVYVLWDRWATVTEQERSEIIMEGYEQARGQDEMLRITLAMGVTPMEAKQLGLDL